MQNQNVSLLELQEQLQFFMTRCAVLRAAADQRGEEIETLKGKLAALEGQKSPPVEPEDGA